MRIASFVLKTSRPAAALLAALLLPAFLLPTWLGAAPVRTLVVDLAMPEQVRFARDLVLLWGGTNVPTAERLVMVIGGDAQTRLRAVNRGRGDFTVVDVAAASEMLRDFPALVAVGVLWPELLHALSTAAGPKALALPLRAPVRVALNARYAYDALREWTQDNPKPSQPITLDREGEGLQLPAADSGEVLLLSALAPLPELAEVLAERGRGLRLIPISNALLEDFRLIYPWLRTLKLRRGTYPRMRRNMEMPARFLVMVGRGDLPGPTVKKMLHALYRKTRVVAPHNAQFAQVRGPRNKLFGELFPFHQATVAAYGIATAGP